MSERFPDEVLQEMLEAGFAECDVSVVDEYRAGIRLTARPRYAAMRAVLEGHLAGRCDNKLTRKVDWHMTDYICGLPRDHEGSCHWRQVASDGSPVTTVGPYSPDNNDYHTAPGVTVIDTQRRSDVVIDDVVLDLRAKHDRFRKALEKIIQADSGICLLEASYGPHCGGCSVCLAQDALAGK